MSKIIRHDAGPILSRAVDYHGFVFLAGLTAHDLAKDIIGQTEEIVGQIDAELERCGTDRTRLLSAQIWVKHIRDRERMNLVWTKWLQSGGAPARACVQAEMAHPDILVEIMVVACK